MMFAVVLASAIPGVVIGAGPGGTPITIGVLTDCAGGFAFTQPATAAGADLALLEHGGRLLGQSPTDGVTGAAVAGRPVRVVFACSDGTSISALAEARLLVEGAGAEIVIGPVTGDEELSLQAYARRRPATTFVDGSGAVQLLDPAPNFFTFHDDGAQWTAGLGSYAFHHLGWRNVVELVDPDVFDWAQAAGFDAEFCSLGGTIAKRISVPPATTDFSALFGELPQRPIDGFFIASQTKVEIALAGADKSLRGNISRRVLGGVFTGPPQPALGERIRGQIIADRTRGGRVPAFNRELFRAFPTADRKFFAGNLFVLDYYTAMKATLVALAADGGDVSQGERRFRATLARLPVATPTGVVTLDAEHQAVAPNYLLRLGKADGSDLKLVRTIPRVEPTFGGYFTTRDPPPGNTTPACRRRRPPAWARSG